MSGVSYRIMRERAGGGERSMRSSDDRERVAGVLAEWHADAVGHSASETLVSDTAAAERLLERAESKPGSWQAVAIDVGESPATELSAQASP